MLFHSYLTRIRKADEAYTIEYESQEPKGPKAATVTAITRTNKAELSFVFHLIRSVEGVWVVEDIVIDEVSLIENYGSSSIGSSIKDGYVVLLQKMADRLVELGGVIPEGISSLKTDKKAAAAPAKAMPASPASQVQARLLPPEREARWVSPS